MSVDWSGEGGSPLHSHGAGTFSSPYIKVTLTLRTLKFVIFAKIIHVITTVVLRTYVRAQNQTLTPSL